jgi:hypothetical protein
MAPVDDRIFVGPRKHFRARYSTAEVGVGAGLLVCLGLIAAWVVWKGEHADPELTAAAPLIRREPPSDRGPIPAGIAPKGWQEQRVAEFNPDNVYVKIDGREGYYKSFGFKKLHCLTLINGETAIDVELYDLDKPANALGAALGEVPQGRTPRLKDGTLSLLDRNALYLVRGKYYLRAIGSSEALGTELAALRDRFAKDLPAAPMPFAYALFAALGVAPAKVTFEAENALSFGFATEVYEAAIDEDTQVFVARRRDAKDAEALAEQFAKGFAEYGTQTGNRSGVRWFKDRYLERVSTAVARDNLVIGVYRAADEKTGAALFSKLVAAAGGKP